VVVAPVQQELLEHLVIQVMVAPVVLIQFRVQQWVSWLAVSIIWQVAEVAEVAAVAQARVVLGAVELAGWAHQRAQMALLTQVVVEGPGVLWVEQTILVATEVRG